MASTSNLLNKESWYRPAIRKIERLIKRLSFGLIGKIMGTKHLTEPIPLDQINRILFLRYDALGDLVLSTPIWRTLKSRRPEIVIGVAGSGKNVDLLRSDSDVDQFYRLSQETNRGIWDEIKRAREIEWDMIVNLVYNDKTRAGIIAWLIKPSAVRVTAVREPPELYEKLYSIVGKRPPLKPPTPMLEQALLTLKTGIGIELLEIEKHPSLVLDPKIEDSVDSMLQQTLVRTRTSRVVHVNTSSAEIFREWGLANAWELSAKLIAEYPDLLVLWTCAPHRAAELTAFLVNHQSNNILFWPTHSPQHLAALVRHVDLVVSPDTSVVHIASAERKPVVGLFMEENEFLPYGISNIVLRPQIDQPLKTIGVDQVFEAACNLLCGQNSRV